LAAEAETPAEAPEEPGGRHLNAFLKLGGAIVGLAAGAVGLLFTFVPDLRPAGDAPTRSATLSNVRLSVDVPFRQYLARIDQPTDSFTRAQLERRGALVQFRVSITGYKGRELILKWELFDAASGDQIDESKATAIRPTSETSEANWPFWIPLPAREGPFFAVVELLEQQEHTTIPLDTHQTDNFAARAPGG
jgi:hypothetical protein